MAVNKVALLAGASTVVIGGSTVAATKNKWWPLVSGNNQETHRTTETDSPQSAADGSEKKVESGQPNDNTSGSSPTTETHNQSRSGTTG